MSFQRGADCLPAVEVERHAAGESIDARWRTHIDRCTHCAAYARELQQGADAFLKARPPELFMRQVERRAEAAPKRRPILQWLTAGVGALVIASLLVLIAPALLAPNDVRVKGGAVEVYYKREGMGEAARVLDGAKLKAGDTLRFRYRAEAPSHVAVIERDAAGTVTVFAPYRGTESVQRRSGQFFTDSITLDDVSGRAKLFVVKNLRRFELSPLVDAMNRGADPSCEGCSVEHLEYEKLP